MPSANKTPNINLNNWSGNERVVRQDFCNDNLIIDAKYKELEDKIKSNTDNITNIQLVDSKVDITDKNNKFEGTKLDAVLDEIDNKILSNAKKSKKIDTILTSTSWAGEGTPYIYNLTVDGVTETNVVEITTKEDLSAEQVECFIDSTITAAGQGMNTVTLKAWANKPSIDLPITVIVRGDL